MKNKKGFTMVELLAVVLVIGVLAVIALPTYRKAQEKSRVVDALKTMDAVVKSEYTWYLAHNKHTKDFGDLDIDFVDKDGLKVTGDSFDSAFYGYDLLDTGILASKSNGEYYLYEDFESRQIMCAPSDHYVCANLEGFTKEPCKSSNLLWADATASCYASEKTRCQGVNPGTNLWHDATETQAAYCGYTNTACVYYKDYSDHPGPTLSDGTQCIGNEADKGCCQVSTVNEGSACIGYAGKTTKEGDCQNSTINSGGKCIAKPGSQYACRKAIINAGAKCEAGTGAAFACNGVTVNTDGECTGDGCDGSIIDGGKCSGKCSSVTVKNNGVCSGTCQYATVTSGGVCSGTCQYAKIKEGGICSGVCKQAEIQNGGICKAGGPDNRCDTASWHPATYTGNGCCCGGNLCGSAPRCENVEGREHACDGI